ncbi:MAG: hypothetical protein IPF53_09820 [Blastocatellia bacterium]|nr:hypothetical protein [Blastocatellia bacterium]MBK6424915.1 hypothetical protein [Blastocatellia bacterium]
MRTRSVTIAVAAIAFLLPLTGCIKADPAKVPESAGKVMGALKDRNYAGMYDRASKPFKGTFTQADFTAKMAGLEGFGQLLDFVQSGDPTVTEEDGDKLAWVQFTAKFALAEGPFKVKLRGNDVTGEWQLDGYNFDISGTTTDPPYPPNGDGAEKLARRFMYLWQNRRYEDLAKTMNLKEEPQRVQEFMKKLENAGDLLTLTRTSYSESTVKGAPAASMDYDIKFDNGSGSMQFELVAVNSEWQIDTVKYNIIYDTDKSKPATNSNAPAK